MANFTGKGIPCLLLLIFLFLFTNLFSQTVTLNPIADNTIYEEDGSLSNGAGSAFFVGRTAGTGGTLSRRALIKFDLSSIPAGSVITNVSLKVVCSLSPFGAPDNLVELHNCLEDWGEGTSNGLGQGALATLNDATWTCRFSNGGANCASSWTDPGGEFDSQTSASVTVSGAGNYTFLSTAKLVADVKNWVDNPGANFGWLLKGGQALKTARGFDSREANPSATVLTISYTAPVTCTGTNKWTGAVSSAWEVAGNWSCGKIPDAETDVEINNGTVVVNSNAACRSINIKPGVIFTINSGFTFNVAH